MAFAQYEIEKNWGNGPGLVLFRPIKKSKLSKGWSYVRVTLVEKARGVHGDYTRAPLTYLFRDYLIP